MLQALDLTDLTLIIKIDVCGHFALPDRRSTNQSWTVGWVPVSQARIPWEQPSFHFSPCTSALDLWMTRWLGAPTPPPRKLGYNSVQPALYVCCSASADSTNLGLTSTLVCIYWKKSPLKWTCTSSKLCCSRVNCTQLKSPMPYPVQHGQNGPSLKKISEHPLSQP